MIDRTVEKAALETRTTFFSDYREVEGVKLPHMVRITNGESKYDQFLSVTSVTWNVPLKDGFAAVPAAAGPDYRFAGGKTESTIPFQLINNHIYVDVTLNGKGPYALLCDTGGQNVMTPTLVKELGLESQGALQGRGVGEKSEDVGFTMVDALSVGDVTLDRQSFAVFALESFGDVAGVPMHGLIGYEVFKRFVVKIDYEKNRLTLTEPAAFTYAGTGTIVPFKFDDSMPQVEGAIDGIPGVFDIDTGSRSSLSVNGPFAETHGLKAKLNPRVTAVTGWGVGGPSRGLVARAGELRLGTLVVKDVVTSLSLQTKGSFSSPYEAGNVGAGVLKRFNLVFEYGKQRIIFEPNAHRDTPDVFDRSGMWVNREGSELVVVDVTAGGPAEAAGIKAGDRILHVDDRPAVEIGLVGLRNRFRSEAPGTSIRLRVLREGAEKGVNLVLKDLV
ncbi:MAG: PDZ domain-containing protein [Acidobacteria bacterium]|nr:MAG: PDZ domain-containing protein [Acidobacteriota bacterium]